MAIIPPQYLECVVSIGVPNQLGDVSWIGTGFSYAIQTETYPDGTKGYATFLVTNRHVLEGHREVVLRFNLDHQEGMQHVLVPLIDDEGQVWFTYEEPDLDIAVLYLPADQALAAGIGGYAFKDDRDVAYREDMAAMTVAEGSTVFVLGYPQGLVGIERNFTIVRRGSVARIRDWLAGHSPLIMVDAQVYPGNSGGPVVTGLEPYCIEGTQPVMRSLLIGVVCAYIPYEDVAISPQTGRPRIVFEENSGLAWVVPIHHAYNLIAQHLPQLKLKPKT